MMGGGPEPPLLLEVVDLHHDTVGLVLEAISLRFESAATCDDGVQIRATHALPVDREATLPQGLEPFPVRGELGRFEMAHVVEEDREGAVCGDGGVLLPDAAGCRV